LKNAIEELGGKMVEKFISDKELNKLYHLFAESPFYKIVREGSDIYHTDAVDWIDIQRGLYDEIKQLKVVVINSKNGKMNQLDPDGKNKRCDYEDYEEEGARVIAIGGMVLSRGLTLEGLMTSYYSRNAATYDTLLQMCRWFGYRPGYEKLCRVYMSKISLLNFDTVLDATEDLKLQFREMNAQGKTPRDFGLMVKESPDILETTMLVTSRNKFGTSKEIVRTLNYSAKPIDTSKLFKSKSDNQTNQDAINSLIEELKLEGNLLQQLNGRFVYKNINKKHICKLLKKLILPIENRKFERDSLIDYIKTTQEFSKWDIVIATGSSKDLLYKIDNFEIPAAQRSFEVRERENYIRISGSNNRLLEPGIFNSGLTKSEIDALKERLLGKMPIAEDWLKVPNRNPLFIIYPIQLKEDKEITLEKEKILNQYKNKIIFGFGLGFPSKTDEVKIKFRANQKKIEELSKAFEEDEDDDYEN
jgi:hypothetical protein